MKNTPPTVGIIGLGHFQAEGDLEILAPKRELVDGFVFFQAQLSGVFVFS